MHSIHFSFLKEQLFEIFKPENPKVISERIIKVIIKFTISPTKPGFFKKIDTEPISILDRL